MAVAFADISGHDCVDLGGPLYFSNLNKVTLTGHYSRYMGDTHTAKSVSTNLTHRSPIDVCTVRKKILCE